MKSNVIVNTLDYRRIATRLLAILGMLLGMAALFKLIKKSQAQLSPFFNAVKDRLQILTFREHITGSNTVDANKIDNETVNEPVKESIKNDNDDDTEKEEKDEKNEDKKELELDVDDESAGVSDTPFNQSSPSIVSSFTTALKEKVQNQSEETFPVFDKKTRYRKPSKGS